VDGFRQLTLGSEVGEWEPKRCRFLGEFEGFIFLLHPRRGRGELLAAVSTWGNWKSCGWRVEGGDDD